MPSIMGLDLETYSSAPLPKCGVYRYCDAPDFEILLFSYAFDDEPIQTIDLASGDVLPQEVISALEDPSIIKVAYNAQFERVCLSRYLGHWLDPHQWRCTMVMAAYLTLPGRLADAAVALGTTEKMEEGKDLIRYFSVPCKPTKTNGGRTRNLPADAPEKWAVYKQYNVQDVETERAIRKALEKYPLPEQEWELYALDQQIRHTAGKQEDPTEKRGIIGAFCRAHSITNVLTHILSDRYTPTEQDDRYTFIGGSTTGGLVVYDDKYAFSHHATDPAGGKLCNAFDLVRWHLFTPGGTAPDGSSVGDEKNSIRRMQEYAAQDEATKRQLAEERSAQAMEEFGDLDTENSASVSSGNVSDENWQDALEIDKQGRVKDTLGNLALILRNDPKLKDIAYNIHRSGIDIRRDADGKTTLPWTQLKPGWNESDLGAIQIYLERVYNLYTPSKLKSILLAIAAERSYHPVRDYIESLPAWDGVPRVDTLFIDYLGSPDTLYIRAIARKMMVAAVARIYEPGIKFDSVVVLNGPQGMGKSSFFARLGGKWFSDSLTISDMKDKAAPEKLQGYWILELGELAGLKKMDVETVKAFITRQDDKFRHSYGYSVEDHPRQCIIVGSTNNGDGFLRDVTGNRRFWPVTCTANSPHRPWEVESVVPQLWAEAWQLYKNGEKLFLTPEEEKQAEMEQTAALESDVREGMIAEYLNTLLPEDWDKMDLAERRGFLRGDQFTGGNRTGTIQRTTVCAVEIWAECFGKDPSTIKRSDTYDIFGMLMKIGGWEKYDGNKTGAMRRSPYGPQRCFVRKA